MVSEEEATPGGFGQVVHNTVEISNAVDRILMSTKADQLQHKLDALMNLFYNVGLRTNFRKYAGMIFQTCRSLEGQ